MFSAGVILFILIRGIFPFKEARKEEFFYNLLANEKYNEYWEKVQGNYLSVECRDLIQKLFSYDPEKRPSLEEIRNHPWMTAAKQPSDSEAKQTVFQMIQQAQEEQAQAQQKTRAQAKKQKYNRGAEEDLAVVSEKPFVSVYKFNYMTDFTTDSDPSAVMEKLEQYKGDANSDLILESDE